MNEPYESVEQFQAHAEELAEAYRRRYGIPEDGAWTDPQIEQALDDARLPRMASLPDEPQGMMRGLAKSWDQPGSWRRVNAMHLLGHVILHQGVLCQGCSTWGQQSGGPGDT